MNDANNGSKLYLYSITTVAILGGLLFGYDTAVISGAEKGLEAFFLMATDFQYDKVMHGITSSSALIGCVIGGALSGFFASRLGRRNSLRLASVLFFLSALGSYYPEFLFFNYGEPNMELLIAFNLYRVLGGIGVGLASAVCPMYIAEIAPSNIRGTLVSCNQFAIIFGMLVVYFVNFLIMGDHTNPIIDKSAEGILSVNAASDMWSVQTGWRYMFGSEAFPAALFGFLLFFVPKTPRYLVLVHQDEKAYSILEKVNGANKAKEILAEIKATSKEKTEKEQRSKPIGRGHLLCLVNRRHAGLTRRELAVERLRRLHHHAVGLVHLHVLHDAGPCNVVALHIGEVGLQSHAWGDGVTAVVDGHHNHQSTAVFLRSHSILIAQVLGHAERVFVLDVANHDKHRLYATFHLEPT